MDEAKYREAEKHLWSVVGLQPSERMISLAGSGTRVRVQEVGEGPNIVFLHGAPNSGSTWAVLSKSLPGFRCILVDRPGTGLSEKASFTSIEAFTGFADRFVADLLDGLGIERTFIVASSLGGFLALRSAAHSPERFDKMVQMACPAMVPGMATPMFMRAMMVGPLRVLIGKLPPNDKANRSIMRQIGHGKSLDKGLIPQDFMDWYLALMRYTDTSRNDGDLIGMGGGFRGFRPEMTLSEDLLRSVETPTHFIWGSDDAFGDEAVARNLVGLLADATLEMLPDAGHLPWLDDPEGVAKATTSFLDAP